MAHVRTPKNKRRMGDTRHEQQRNMESYGWSAGMTEEQCQRSEYLHKKGGFRWLPGRMLDNAHLIKVDGPSQTPNEKYLANYDEIRWDEKED
jgi:hypothetical protein